MHPEIKINNNCSKCLSCSQICPTDSIFHEPNTNTIDHFSCTLCELCILICPEEAISIDEGEGETTATIVTSKQESSDDIRAPGDVSVEVQVIGEKRSDTSDVLAVTGSHLIDMEEPVSDSELARETLSTDVKHEQESVVVHPALHPEFKSLVHNP